MWREQVQKTQQKFVINGIEQINIIKAEKGGNDQHYVMCLFLDQWCKNLGKWKVQIPSVEVSIYWYMGHTVTCIIVLPLAKNRKLFLYPDLKL